jgi:hypothetical protein
MKLISGEYGKLVPIFEVFPKFGQEVEYLLQHNKGRIQDAAITADDDSILCSFNVQHDTGLIEIHFFSSTETLFVEFHDMGQFPTGYRLDLLDNTISIYKSRWKNFNGERSDEQWFAQNAKPVYLNPWAISN